MLWIISPFIILNSGVYRAAVLNYSAQSYQTIPLSAAAVLARFTQPLNSDDLLAAYAADEREVLESYLELFRQNGWILPASFMANFVAPDLVHRKPVKRVQNLYLHTSTLAAGHIEDFAQLRRETGVNCLLLLPDNSDFQSVERIIATQLFRRVAIVVFEVSQLLFANSLANSSSGKVQFFIHERVFNSVKESTLQFSYDVIEEHRVKQPSDFVTDIRLLLNNYHYAPGVGSIYVDTSLNVYPHPLDKDWPLGSIAASMQLRSMLRGEAFVSYQQSPRRFSAKCEDCELNLACVLSLRSRRDPKNLRSEPTHCYYDVPTGEFNSV